jgi:hypothetical protein
VRRLPGDVVLAPVCAEKVPDGEHAEVPVGVLVQARVMDAVGLRRDEYVTQQAEVHAQLL